MSKSVKTYLWVGLVTSIFVAAGVLTVVFIVLGTEAGFMHPDKAWDVRPITVSCRGHVPERAADCDHVDAAIDTFNRRLGGTLLERVDGEAHVTVVIGAPAEPGWRDPGGDAVLTWEGDRFVHCDATTSNTGNDELLFMTVQHELGHCVDLDHDGQDTSIMRRVQRPVGMGAFPPRISDSDRDLLRERYGL